MSSSLESGSKPKTVVETARITGFNKFGQPGDGNAGHRLSFKPYPNSGNSRGDVLTLDREHINYLISGIEPLDMGGEVVLYKREGEILAITTMTRRPLLLYLADPSVMDGHEIDMRNMDGEGGHVYSSKKKYRKRFA